MNVTIPPSDHDINIASIKRAIDSKEREVDKAQRSLVDLQAELRGLQIALKAIDRGETKPRSFQST